MREEPDNDMVDHPHVTLNDIYESNAAILTVLMRLYDVGMAQLRLNGHPTTDGGAIAQELYNAHKNGELWNPPLLIPNLTGDDNA